jgi:hypothetical protein
MIAWWRQASCRELHQHESGDRIEVEAGMLYALINH